MKRILHMGGLGFAAMTVPSLSRIVKTLTGGQLIQSQPELQKPEQKGLKSLVEDKANAIAGDQLKNFSYTEIFFKPYQSKECIPYSTPFPQV